MKTTHFILQGKGGVGKSVIATLLYQYFVHKGCDVRGFDADPVNKTLYSYKGFNVESIEVMDGDTINDRKWDLLMGLLLDAPDGSQLVVDNGASSFVALASYIKSNDVIGALTEEGHTIYFHSVITGGLAIRDTVTGLKQLCTILPSDTQFVVWLNPFFGPIEMDGKSFEEFQVYGEYREQFQAVLRLPTVNPQTLGQDLVELFAKRQSFEAAVDSTQTHLMVRRRLKKYWDDVVALIDLAELV